MKGAPMRILAALVVAAMVIWGGWWFVGSSAETRAVKAFFAAQAAQGRSASYSSLAVEGFPNRFDLTVNDIALGDPAAGVIWRAPFAQVLALSYNPYHYIAALPHRQEIDTPDGSFTVTSDKMEASLRLAPGLALTLREAVAVVARPGLSSSLGWAVTAQDLRGATRQMPGRPLAQEIGLQIDKPAPDAALKARLDPKGALPAAADQLYLDAEAGFDAPIDRHMGTRPPQLTDLRVKDFHIAWGPMLLSAQGKLTVNADGYPEGRIDLRAKDWQAMIDMAVGLDLLKPELAPTVRNMFTELATGSPDPNTVDLPVSFQKGFMSIGPLPLGPAPRLR